MRNISIFEFITYTEHFVLGEGGGGGSFFLFSPVKQANGAGVNGILYGRVENNFAEV